MYCHVYFGLMAMIYRTALINWFWVCR